jgi:hypothetical protein
MNFAPYQILMPADAVRTPLADVLKTLEQHFGDRLYAAFDPTHQVASPVQQQTDTQWIKTANCVGVNVRTIGSFWHLVPYALTLPKAQNAIHILPIWEPGVVASLYGMASWHINPEFFSAELAEAFPHLDTVEKQLCVVINLLHLLDKVVGMDVVPHTDRYAEQVIANPRCFEWLQRRDLDIVQHQSNLWQQAEALIFSALQNLGSATRSVGVPDSSSIFFEKMPESTRLLLLFGAPDDYVGRLARRKVYVQWLYENGFETVPATMAPPYRGLEVDPSPEAQTIDEEGRTWRDYRIAQPQPMSRVFGPLARYRLYESHDDNRDWQLDFEQPIRATWDYVCDHYAALQRQFNFDFMRGDMSHVQMRPGGVPAQPDAFYDLLGAVKRVICLEKPYFAYFAESFLAPPNDMAYGDECDHLEASLADSTLGDLQSEPIDTAKFMRDFAQYRQWLDTRRFAPNFTIMTADKDDPRFDGFYLRGNELRHFMALFLTDMPSYMGLGFECRDVHTAPAPNEHYTKLYVFQVPDGPKSTHGPYQWGQNRHLYAQLVAQKQVADQLHDQLQGHPLRWLVPPDPTGERRVLVWVVGAYVFAANLGTEAADCDVAHLTGQRLQHVLTSPNEMSYSPQKIAPLSGNIWQVVVD